MFSKLLICRIKISKNKLLICLSLLLLFYSVPSKAQNYLKFDFTNYLLQNFNAGFEKQIENKRYGIDLTYINRAFVWQYEFPGIEESRGFRTNLDFKISPKKSRYAYFSVLARIESIYLPETTHRRAYYTYDRKDFRFIIVPKAGLSIGSGWIAVDFNLGPGLKFLNRKQEIISTYAPPIGQSAEDFWAEANTDLSKHVTSVSIVPMFQLTTKFRIGKK